MGGRIGREGAVIVSEDPLPSPVYMVLCLPVDIYDVEVGIYDVPL